MFLLVSARHVGAHPDEHQHGVPIQISINMGKTFLRIYSFDPNLGEGLCIFTSFHFPDSGKSIERFWFLFWSIDLFWMAWHWKPAILRPSFVLLKNNLSPTLFTTVNYSLSIWMVEWFLQVYFVPYKVLSLVVSFKIVRACATQKDLLQLLSWRITAFYTIHNNNLTH